MESPTIVHAIQVFKMFQARYISCETDDHGLFINPQGPLPPETNKPYEFFLSRRSSSWREGKAEICTTKRCFDAMDYPGDNSFRLVRNG